MKVLDLSVVLKDFEGKTVKDGDGGIDLTLGRALLFYCRNGNFMNLDDAEQTTVYTIGMVVASNMKDKIELSQEQYNVIKKMADFGKIIDRTGVPREAFGLEVKGQIRALIDSAETVEESAKDKT